MPEDARHIVHPEGKIRLNAVFVKDIVDQFLPRHFI
jgi:hypothetical protein